ncbi:Structural maintenance of chromosomes protein 4 [Blastocladiella emersonii ATCC 22665]|nr:Structural maintenance of chromosomes protein 4 [Blastocladiella emersonii ATCC 22665]
MTIPGPPPPAPPPLSSSAPPPMGTQLLSQSQPDVSASQPASTAAAPRPLAQPAKYVPDSRHTALYGMFGARGWIEKRQRLVITQMVLRDFKSYAGVQTIGPFHKSFTAIVGPNGSGKSNVIDALLFVFGYRASKMRQSKIGHLIHKSEAFPDLPQCSVEIHFQEILEEGGDTTPVPGTQLVVSRSATRNHQSRYFLDGTPSTYAEITSLLKGKGIDLDHNRFLILQGEVESIAQMKAKAATEHDEGLLEYLEDIIGTSQFKEPIETATRELEVLQERRNEKLARVRLIEHELTRLEDGKAAAEAYLGKENRLRQYQGKLYRHHRKRHANSLDVARQAVAEARRRIEKLDAEHNAPEQQTRKAGLERAVQAATQALAAARKRVDPLAAELARLNNEDVKQRELKKSAVTKLKKLAKTHDKARRDEATHAAAMADLDDDAARLETELADLAAQLESAQTKLDEMQIDVRFLTKDLQAELDALHAELRPWTTQVRQKEQAVAALHAERARVTDTIARATAAHARIEKQVGVLDAQQAELTERAGTAAAEHERAAAALAELRNRGTALAADLQTARGDAHEATVKAEDARRQLASTRDRGTVLAALREQRAARWPGLRDRLGNLGTVPGKFDVAVSTAVGNLDHIVVDTVATAQKCLDFLRTERLGRANLICLDKLPRYDIQPLQTPEGVPRLFDLVVVRGNDEALRQAFYHAMRDTLVAADLDQANRIAFNGKRRWRVVTLDGQLIDTSGTMSGGGNHVSRGRMKLSGASAGDAMAVDEPEVTQDMVRELDALRTAAQARAAELKRQLDAVEAEADALARTAAQAETDAAKARVALADVNKQLDAARTELAALVPSEGKKKSKRSKETAAANPIDAAHARAAAIETELAALETDLAAVREHASVVEAKVAAQQAKIDEAGGVEYKVLKSRVADLTKRAEMATRAAAKARVQRNQAEKQLAAARAILATAHTEQAALEATVAQISGVMDALTVQALDVSTALETVQAETEDAEDKLKEVSADLREFEDANARYLRERAEAVAVVDDFTAKANAAEGQVAAWAAKLRELKEAAAATRRTLTLPRNVTATLLAAAAARAKAKAQADAAAAGKGESVAVVDDSEAEEGAAGAAAAAVTSVLGTPPNGGNGAGDDPNAIPVVVAADVFDGDGDDDADDNNDGPIDVPSLEREIKQLASELAGTQANLGALVEYRMRELELGTRAHDLAATEEARDAQKRATDALKRTRFSTFMAGFAEITSRLKDMYALITAGGNAELELVDSMDPFAEGIVFSVMPPRKSWKQIANLSGGERTLASLALVFALHAYRPTPLYVLDEIDAALDFRNVSIIANYVREQSTGPHAAQFIIISLRHNMFELADRLVGIYKTNNCTKAITINPSEVAERLGIQPEANAPGASGVGIPQPSQQQPRPVVASQGQQPRPPARPQPQPQASQQPSQQHQVDADGDTQMAEA